MKRARSSISPPTLQSVDPIDLRALSDELDLSDLMRRTVISTIDEWAETPPISANSNLHTPSPPPKPQVNHPFHHLLPEDMDSHPPNSPVRLWASIRRLWQAVFPGESDIHQEHRALDNRYPRSPEIIRATHVPQPTHHSFEHLTPTALNFEEDVARPSQAVPKVDTEHSPQRPKPSFDELAQVPPKHDNERATQMPQPVLERPTQASVKFDTPKNARMRQPLFDQPTQAAVKETTDSERPPQPLFGQLTRAAVKDESADTGRPPQPLFGQPTRAAVKDESADTGPPPKPLFGQSTRAALKDESADTGPPSKPLFGQPTRAALKFESPQSRQMSQPLFQQPTLATAGSQNTKTGQPPQLLFQRPVEAAAKVETAQISQPSHHPPNLFTDFPEPKETPMSPFEAADFFDADLREEDVDLNLPSDNELLDLCSRLTSPSQQSQRRRITGDPAIDRRLAHLEALRQQIRQRRENDKDADMIRHRRKQRLIEEQRKIASSLRVQRVSNVPRNVKLPVPTRRSRLSRVKDARARGGISSPTGIFEGATRFQY